MMGLGKRGDGILIPVVIFILLNIVIAAGLSIFIWNASTNAGVFEEAYAKQITFLINKGEPGTTILLNMEKPARIFAKNKFDEKVFDGEEFSKIVVIDNEAKTVTVNLKNRGGYRMEYFSGNFIETNFRDDGFLVIRVLENLEIVEEGENSNENTEIE